MRYQNLQLDPFQEKAVAAIERGESLIIAAPTGCGKTLIAEYAVEVSLRLGRRAVYTAPVKALSNQKFRDFRHRFGERTVGIQTGDVTINQGAPLLIMTTEIFRNLILENSGRLSDIHYTIFDEIHYLDDPERGTVWEESIILAPPEIRFMCLSATVPNIRELSRWMETVRRTSFTMIEETARPVPLKHYFYSPKFGMMGIKAVRRKYRKDPAERKRFLRRKPSSKRIVRLVLEQGNVPVLYFCFNRKACEYHSEQHSTLELLDGEERRKVRAMVDELV
ncbi:MAG: DEAD/DEAH box helicase, partial [Chitinispirillaceae bacterium]|nr:DEAD/DEAH box helicase [Chitinispirillaceae bacterium]